MDRVTNYFGALVRETDLLQSQQNEMVAMGWEAQGFLGSAPFTPASSFTTQVDGFTLTPTTPASLNVILTPGQIYNFQSLESTIWSSLPANTAQQIVKQGIMNIPDTLTLAPPGTLGFSQVYLIEVQYADLDTNPVLLPYYNAANPAVPFSGPAGNGQSQNTARLGIVAVQIKAGTAAATGSQVNPTPDPGFVGLFYVTLSFGQTTITSGNIVTILSAPWVPTKLPQVPGGVLNGTWIYCLDTGTANAYAGTIWPIPSQLIVGMQVRVKILHANTGASTFALNGLGTAPIIRASGSALSSGDLSANQVVDLTFDGSNWQIANFQGVGSGGTNNFFSTTGLPYCSDSSLTANTITAPFSPAIPGSGVVAGLTVEVKLANTITSSTVTITVNSNPAANVVNPDGYAFAPGDLKAGMILILVFDGTNYQVCGIRSVAPTLPTKAIELVGSGQGITINIVTKITCFTTVVRNTLVSSTWDGQNFTVGVGEDGLWSFWTLVDFGDSSTWPALSGWGYISRTRSGVTKYWQLPFMGVSAGVSGFEDTYSIGQTIMDLQVGDVVNFWAEVDATTNTSTPVPLFARSEDSGFIPGVQSNVYGFRLGGLH